LYIKGIIFPPTPKIDHHDSNLIIAVYSSAQELTSVRGEAVY